MNAPPYGTDPTGTRPDTFQGWLDALEAFDRATRTGEDFVPPRVDGPDGLGPMPDELREHAERLLAECTSRAAAVRAEMDELDRERVSLRSRAAARRSWTDDAQGAEPAVGHLV